jgi:serine/threonine protein kinase
MKRIFDEATDAKRAYREMHILRNLKHPAVVALLDVVSSTIDCKFERTYMNPRYNQADTSSSPFITPLPRSLGDIYLVFEFVDTDLSKIIKSNQFLSSEHIQFILYQILDGLNYIHGTNVIHRDLKPANILVSCTDCTIKVADFGLSRVVGADLIVQHQMQDLLLVESALEATEIVSPADKRSKRMDPSGSLYGDDLLAMTRNGGTGAGAHQHEPMSSSTEHFIVDDDESPDGNNMGVSQQQQQQSNISSTHASNGFGGVATDIFAAISNFATGTAPKKAAERKFLYAVALLYIASCAVRTCIYFIVSPCLLPSPSFPPLHSPPIPLQLCSRAPRPTRTPSPACRPPVWSTPSPAPGPP